MWIALGMGRHLSKSPERVDLRRLLVCEGGTRPALAMSASF